METVLGNQCMPNRFVPYLFEGLWYHWQAINYYRPPPTTSANVNNGKTRTRLSAGISGI